MQQNQFSDIFAVEIHPILFYAKIDIIVLISDDMKLVNNNKCIGLRYASLQKRMPLPYNIVLYH